MSPHFRIARAMLLAALALPAAPAVARADLPAIVPNDNRTPAGRMERGELVVRLEAREGVWRPDGPRGTRFDVAAFAEPGKPLQAPGPLIRATAGTRVRVVVRNGLAMPLWVWGLGQERGTRTDSTQVMPGESREFAFTAREAGTYWYQARTMVGRRPPGMTRDAQLHGAIVVDSAGASTASRRDRVFVVSDWFTLDSTTVSGLGPNATLAINGLAWPHTERLDAAQGDTVRWRIVNVTTLEHPFHLHGFYFMVDARGNGVRDTAYARADRRRVVTEVMLPRTTMAMTWVPEKSGNWIFHCHFASHITAPERFEMDRRMPSRPVSSHDAQHDAHAEHGVSGVPAVHGPAASAPPLAAAPEHDMHAHMAGLVLGIRVRPRGPQPVPAPVTRHITLEVRSKANVYGESVGYAYVLGGSPEAQDAAAMPIPGPTLVLNKDERVAIRIVNRSHEPAAVHWHGIELESFPDGVPGWSGAGKTTLPLIAPNDSFTVRFTPPRAGTFMYHSHANEMQQISSGLYGAIVVVDPAAPRDTARERLLLFSDGGPYIKLIGPPPPVLLNGERTPKPLELRVGETYRLRLINIRGETFEEVALLDGDRPVEWRVIAVDGADAPAHQAGPVPAQLMFAPGQIRDVAFTPTRAGTLTLRYQNGRMPPGMQDERKVEVVVRQ